MTTEGVRTVGVEEEFVLVDPDRHAVRAAASRALRNQGSETRAQGPGRNEAKIVRIWPTAASQPCSGTRQRSA
ncbi:hypothetical protein FF36_05566 [Frankia torreyi]|uniref:Uncharacterized protein n=1 Tax=Frankia torreyi TaxID=1856 RepID=A0A0D8B765_9ACTN|nr:hypothetical protein FF36_05566 [Frankia torreyi]KQM02419.1 hypothetical protein FF86_106817 [Frankia sp. CpI1-P]